MKENNQSTAEERRMAPPTISLPKGGGAIRGIGEKFSANPVTGTGSISVPIFTSPGRSDFTPKLSLDYSTGAGNGVFGLGWNLSIPCITRKTEKGLPRYRDAEDSDTFILSGAEDLVPALKKDLSGWVRDVDTQGDYTVQRYRPRIEGLFARIERWVNNFTGETHWKSISPDNVTSLYGKSQAARIYDLEDPSRVFEWLLEESYDDKGNVIVYEYKQENIDNVDHLLPQERNRLANGADLPNRYLKRIKYANLTPFEKGDWLFQVVFDYGEHDPDNPEADSEATAWACRPDAFSSYRAGFEIRTYRLCRRALMFHHFPQELGASPYLVRSTDFVYQESPVACYLTAATQTGYIRESDTGDFQKKSLPPLEFTYTPRVLNQEVRLVDDESLENLPVGLDDGMYQWLDLDGEGVSGILTDQAGAWFYKRNLGGARFGPVQAVANRPSLANLAAGQQQFMDLAGDGQLDLVQLSGPAPGYYERDDKEGWRTFTSFDSCPNVNWGDPNLKLIDLTGDGHADVMISENEVFVYYPSRAEAGFDAPFIVRKPHDEEKGPAIVFSDRTQTVFLSDMSGDGLTDIARIRNGEICYWPNLGYGRFGAKVTMSNAPCFDYPDQFDPNRIKVADIDGSGTTDILYLDGDRVTIWHNQAGNSWSEPHKLTGLPPLDNVSSVSVVDLLGSGTACIVWSSPLPAAKDRPLRYVDLMGGVKPHLLNSIKNNLGAETRLYYSTSTRFYLEDLAAGRPWVTRLPFPVHVVERVETYDWISQNRFVTRYAYHHGYYDGPEREFRGFGMVEQWDTEEFAAFGSGGGFPEGMNIDSVSHIPPVLTKTWFHTGAYTDRDRISNYFEGDYYREPLASNAQFRASLLPDTLLPVGLTKPDGSLLAASLSANEEREACRALKGSILRQEIYGLDDSPVSVNPYSVSERNYEIKWLQPGQDNQCAVFFAHSRESVDYYYERNPSDPRVSHQLTLKVDAFGHVLRSIGVGYGRRQPDMSLSDEDRAKQTQILVTYAENDFTNGIDLENTYRTPLPCETRTYEITGLELVGAARFSFADLVNVGTAAVEIPYEASPDGSLQKRLIEHVRTLYFKDDLSGSLPLGQAQLLALPYETYNLAFTPGLLAEVYQGRVDEIMLKDECRYIESADYIVQGLFPEEDQGDLWWKPAGRFVFAPDAADHFFLPDGVIDPFGNSYAMIYDPYDLLIEQTIDPLGNVATAQNHYRTLLPWKLVDANGNRSAVRFDELGMTVATVVMGKPGQNEADHLDETSIEKSGSDDPTRRLEYHLFNWMTNAGPNFVHTFAREKHGAQNPRWQETYVYSDGFGREVQTKIQAEPGMVDGAFVSERWAGTGWAIYNNKGGPVKKYEPFFSDTFDFEFAKEIGVGSTFFYDPLRRVVATLHPNHTYEKINFDPWRQETWDVNDTLHPNQVYNPQTPNLLPDHTFNPVDDPDVGRYFERIPDDEYLPTWYDLRMDAAKAAAEWPDADPATGDPLPQNASVRAAQKKAAQETARHAATPSVAHLDTLGRTFLSVVDNGLGEDGLPRRFHTRVEFDIEGNQRWITDALGRTVMAFDYDINGNRLHQAGMDAGERWLLPDVAGKTIRGWDSRGHTVRTSYDELRRATHIFVKKPGEAEILTERTVFGEAHASGMALNLRGRIYQVFDGVGSLTNLNYDFNGNVLTTGRQLAIEYKQQVDWSVLDGLTDAQAITSAAAPFLEAETFTTSMEYDALDRPTTIAMPDDSEVLPAYNEANLLEKIAVRLRGAAVPTSFIEDIEYNARGQREAIEYSIKDADATSKVIRTQYAYDPLTFRMTGLKSTRTTDNRKLQDLNYTYDPAGNIVEIRDSAQQTTYFNNAVVEPRPEYRYDALYRLIEATGREHIGQIASPQVDHDDSPRINQPLPTDGQALRSYKENYEYDAVGNILKIVHEAGSAGSWSRRYEYESSNNRLRASSLPGDPEGAPLPTRYEYDVHGNMTRMPHLPLMRWSFRDKLQASSQQVVNSGTPETTYYVYDAAGERVRKVTEAQAAAGQTPVRVKERIYLGGYEVYREYNSNGAVLKLERETVHVMDQKQRIALVETKTVDLSAPPFSPMPLVRYQLGNHLGSASLELDAGGEIISYEEYHPYGSTSYQAVASGIEVSLKRYRYTGKERDEETGLYFHVARYYAPWLGRWTAADPAGLVDGVNLYIYVSDNPIILIDPTGTQEVSPASQPKRPGPPRVEPSFTGEAIRMLSGAVGVRGIVRAPSPPEGLPEGLKQNLPGQDALDASAALTTHTGGVAAGIASAGMTLVATAPSLKVGLDAAGAWILFNPGKVMLIKMLGSFGVGLLDPHPAGASPINLPGPEDEAGRMVRVPLVKFVSEILPPNDAVHAAARVMSPKKLATAIKETWELDLMKMAPIRGEILEAVLAATKYKFYEWVGKLNKGFFEGLDFFANGIGIQLKTLQGLPKVAEYKGFIDKLLKMQGTTLPGRRHLKSAALHIGIPEGYKGPKGKEKEFAAAIQQIKDYGAKLGISVNVFEVKPEAKLTAH